MHPTFRTLLTVLAIVAGVLLSAARKPAPFVLPTSCVGCTDCTKVCPAIKKGAIVMTNGKAVIDPVACIGCNNCITVCGFSAIERATAVPEDEEVSE